MQHVLRARLSSSLLSYAPIGKKEYTKANVTQVLLAQIDSVIKLDLRGSLGNACVLIESPIRIMTLLLHSGAELE